MKHGVKIFFMAIALIQISIFPCKAEKGKKVSEIIFWKYDEKLSVEYLDSIDFKNAIDEFHVAAVMDFSMFTSYKKNSDSDGDLFFYIEEDEYDEDLWFDPARNLWQTYADILFDIENIEDGCYFSIIIDGKIVLNGLNMIFPHSAAMLPIDYYTCPKIFWENSNKLNLCYENFNKGDSEPMLQDQEIIKYFENK